MPVSTTFAIDLDRCWGCGTCEVACALEKKSGPGTGRIKIEEVRGKNGEAIPGSLQGRGFVPVLCQQCEDPACAAACPAGALFKDASGLVVFEAETCLSCGACESACPYGAIQLSADSGQPMKCDQCASRQRAGLLPACIQHCPGKALAIVADTAIVGGGTRGMETAKGTEAGRGMEEAAKGTEAGRGPKRAWSIGRVEYRSRGIGLSDRFPG